MSYVLCLHVIFFFFYLSKGQVEALLVLASYQKAGSGTNSKDIKSLILNYIYIYMLSHSAQRLECVKQITETAHTCTYNTPQRSHTRASKYQLLNSKLSGGSKRKTTKSSNSLHNSKQLQYTKN